MIGRRSMVLVMAAVGVAAMMQACGSPGANVRPDAPTYAGSANVESCEIVDGRHEPFLVDWRADKRGDLEAALGKSVVVVSYDCKKLRVLSDCRAKGTYSFVGLAEKEQLLRLESAEEVKANLPLSAAKISGSLGGELARGATLDVAMAIVGKRMSTRPHVIRTELEGDCEGATHFVRSAMVGAFVMRTGTRGAVKVAADLFGGSASAGSSSAESIENRDGSVEACRTAKPDADTPPAQCAAPLRLELRAIRSEPPTASMVAAAADETPRCPKGLVALESGKCTLPSAGTTHLCVPEDPADCGVQCDRGSLTSCSILGRSYMLGRGVPKDLARAKALLGRACDGDVAQACGRLGEIAFAEKDLARSKELLDRSCSAGWFTACETLGKITLALPGVMKVDPFALFKRSCNAGDPEGCWGLGSLFSLGLGVRKSDTEAFKYFTRACDGGARLGCVSVSTALDEGRGTAPDPEAAAKILEGPCERAYFEACRNLGMFYFRGRGVPRDPARSVKLLDRACEGGDGGGCLLLATQYLTGGSGLKRDEARSNEYFTRACQLGIEPACMQVQKRP